MIENRNPEQVFAKPLLQTKKTVCSRGESVRQELLYHTESLRRCIGKKLLDMRFYKYYNSMKWWSKKAKGMVVNYAIKNL